MKKILISACLLGENVRYDGKNSKVASEILERWMQEKRLIPVCPEVLGGLPVPRSRSEIVKGTGQDVIDHLALVKSEHGEDFTDYFIKGARKTLQIAIDHNVKYAIFKSKSPSCGSGKIYDGTFKGQLKEGDGVTVALLKKYGIQMFTEKNMEELEDILRLQEMEE